MAELTHQQQIIFYTFGSLTVALYLATLMLSLHNIVVYLVGQKRYKTSGGLLLTIFYGLSLPVIIFRVTVIINQLLDKDKVVVDLVLALLATMSQIDVGITMILIIQKISIMLRDLQLEQFSENSIKQIELGGLIAVLVTNIPIVVGISCYRNDHVWITRIANIYCAVCLSLIFVFLSASIAQVFSKIKQVHIHVDKLRTEKLNLKIMLVAFDLAFLIRIILECTVYPKAYSDQLGRFGNLMWTTVPGIFVDVMPLMSVMLLHHINFKRQVN